MRDVATHRELALRPEIANLTRGFEFSPHLTCLFHDGKIVAINSAGTKMLEGTAPSNFLGVPLSQFFSADYADILDLAFDDLCQESTSVPFKMKTLVGNIISTEINTFWARDLGPDIPDLKIVSATDITGRVRMFEDIQRSEARYRKLVNQAQNMICMVTDKKISFINRAGMDLLKVKHPEDILGIHLHDLFQTEHQDIIEHNIQQIIDENIPLLAKMDCLDDGALDVRLTLAPLENSENFIYMAEIQNVTDHNKAAMDLHKSNQNLAVRAIELLEAKEAAEMANRFKVDFLANMSHELRPPLNAIIGFSELIQSESMGPIEIQQYLDFATEINDSGAHLLQVVSDVLDVTKIEKGDLDYNPQEMSLTDAITSALEHVQERATNAKIQVEYHPHNDPLILIADGSHIRQILLNLLSNAIKFSNPGERVEISAHTDSENCCVLRILDHGIGMDSSELEAILQPFNKVTGSPLDGTYDGTGLGLSIVNALVEVQNAILEIESTLGDGTSVSITFPAQSTVN